MRYLYIAALAGLLPHLAAAQAAADSVTTDDADAYPVAVDERWVRSQVDSTGECIEVLHWSGRGGLVRVFHPSGRLKQYVPYADLAAERLHGVVTTWYDDGQLAAFQSFVRGQREGELRLYYPTGQLKRQTQYEAGSELLGDCFDSAGLRLPYFPYEQPPLYPGGPLQLTKELSQALRGMRPAGPVHLSRAQIHVNFQVSENGSIANPQVTLTDEKYIVLPGWINNEANWQTTQQQTTALLVGKVQQALTRLTKSFYPGQRDGATVNWQYSLTIPFDQEGPPPRWGTVRRPRANFGP